MEQLANELSRWRWDDYVVMASSILALSLGVLFLIINPPISIGFLVCAAALALSLWRLRDCAIGRDLWDSVAVLRIENAKLSSSVSELRLINQDLSQSVENLNDISDHLNVSVRTLQIQTDQLNSSLVTLSNLNGNLSLAIDNLASNNEELGDNLLAVKALRDELQVQLKEESLVGQTRCQDLENVCL